MNIIGDKVRDIRKRKGFTQHYVADSVGISCAALSKLENGKIRCCTYDNLKKLSLTLETPLLRGPRYYHEFSFAP